MAKYGKILAQSVAITSVADIYTVPAATRTAITAISFCNTHDTTDATVNMRLAIAGAANAASQSIADALPVPANETVWITFPQPIWLAPTDVVRYFGSAATVAAGVYGWEEV